MILLVKFFLKDSKICIYIKWGWMDWREEGRKLNTFGALSRVNKERVVQVVQDELLRKKKKKKKRKKL